MKSVSTIQREIQKRDPTPTITKIVLAVVFVLSLVVIVTGVMGMRTYSASGFSSESGYKAVYKLSGDVQNAWKALQPQLDKLTAEQRATVDEAAHRMLVAAWDGQTAGGGQAAEDAIAQADDNRDGAALYKLLYTTYLTGGPKVGASARKELTAIPAARQEIP